MSMINGKTEALKVLGQYLDDFETSGKISAQDRRDFLFAEMDALIVQWRFPAETRSINSGRVLLPGILYEDCFYR